MKQLLMLCAVLIVLDTGCNSSNDDKTSNSDSLNNTATTTTTTTRTVRTVEVTPVIKASFEKSYPTAKEVAWVKYEPMPEIEPIDIDWEMTGWPTLDTSDYMANFTVDNSPYWSWYTTEGDWVGTYTPVNTSGLPDPVNATVQREFPGYTISSVNKEIDKKRTAYEIKMQNGDDKMKALIAENGALLKKKGKEGGIKIKEKPVKDS